MTGGNLRLRQLEKARKMIKTAVVIADTNSKANLTPVFTQVINAFNSLGQAANEASVSIANLIPNIRKRG